jgi:predicted RND superfamily exporter protein
MKAKCNCDIKIEVKSETSKIKFYPNKIIENFYKIESYTNIKIVKCYEEVFNLNKIKKNYGSYFMIIIGLFFIISMFLLFLNIDNKITKNIQKFFFQYKHIIVQLSHLEKEKEKEKQININLKRKTNINTKEKIRKNIKNIEVKLDLKNKMVNESKKSTSKTITKKYLIKKKKNWQNQEKPLILLIYLIHLEI